MKRKTIKRSHTLISLALTLAMSAGIFAPIPANAKSKSVDELNQDISKYQQQIDDLKARQADEAEIQDALNKKIDALNEKISTYQTQIDTLQNDINIREQKIGSLNDDILAKQAEIEQKNADIQQKEAEKEETIDLLKERMRADYMSGRTTVLDVLFSADDFGSFISSMEYIKRIAGHDQELVDTLEQQVSEIETAKSEVETAMADLETQKADAEAQRDEVQAQRDELAIAQSEQTSAREELNGQLANSEAAVGEMAAQQEELESNLEDAEEAIRRAVANNSGSGGNAGASTGGSTVIDAGGYLYPVQGRCYVSDPYGSRGGSHKGMDIATYGNPNPIVASRGGTVVVSMYGYRGSGFGGYGEVVVIDHGDGYQTLYAHCSARFVQVGDHVERGEHIANVGSTGDSTGYHCHFELRRNGVAVAPPF